MTKKKKEKKSFSERKTFTRMQNVGLQEVKDREALYVHVFGG